MVSELGFEMFGFAKRRSPVCWMLFLESSRLFCSFSTSYEAKVLLTQKQKSKRPQQYLHRRKFWQGHRSTKEATGIS